MEPFGLCGRQEHALTGAIKESPSALLFHTCQRNASCCEPHGSRQFENVPNHVLFLRTNKVEIETREDRQLTALWRSNQSVDKYTKSIVEDGFRHSAKKKGDGCGPSFRQ